MLPYEVLEIDQGFDKLSIRGWGFINHNQHFLDTSTHEISIEFQSRTHQFSVQATLRDLDMTSLMHYRGSPMCYSSNYLQKPSICNYNYKNVGFYVEVPYDTFAVNETYHAMLVVHAKQTKTTYKTKLYFPMKDSMSTLYDDYKITIDSSIHDTQLIVNHSNVVVRNGPSSSYPIYRIGQICSTTYQNQLFYKENSMFYNIKNKVINNNITYYTISGDVDHCFNHRLRVKEGQAINPIVIASSFVEYGGKMLTINRELVNDPPLLSVEHPTINENEPFDYSMYVSAYDIQEKDLTGKIIVESNNFIQKAGRYSLVFYVEDKHGAFDRKTMNVTVTKIENTPPLVFALDRTINQFDAFDPLDGVYATDKEDGDLTSSILLTNQVDTNVLGEFNQCYLVADSMSATATKCVTITIIKRNQVDTHRFVHANFLFDLHSSWQHVQFVFEKQLNNENPLHSVNK